MVGAALMRNLTRLSRYRVSILGYTEAPHMAHAEGAFIVPSPTDRRPLKVIAATALGWDHVSVSREDRIPDYAEMQTVFRLFFRDDETAMQLHLPVREHRNCHPYCLHIWRPNDGREIVKPPADMVAPKPTRNR
jgi:hypothetical protein